ncbi:MAG: phosphatidylinositol-3-phosphatase [Thermoanaerobaculia bacterium]
MFRRLLVLLLSFLIATTTTPLFAKRRAARSLTGMVEVQRVVVVILENADQAQAIAQPYLSYLARHGAMLTNYHAVAHPSQPNYFALTAGDTYGVTTDNTVAVDATHIGDLMDASHLTWRVYAENYPGNCYLGDYAGSPQTGQYLRKHNPFFSYADVVQVTERCSTVIVDAAAFDADILTNRLPQLSFYIPNSYDDGHETSLAFADAWLRTRFDPLLSDPRFIAGTLFVVVFDEAISKGPNSVYCSFYGAGVNPGVTSSELSDHYSLLRTIEDIFHLGTLHRHDETAAPIAGIWRQ